MSDKPTEWGSAVTTEWELDGQPALVLLHMQNGIVDARPSIRASSMIEHQQRLLAVFRERGLPVIFVNAIPNPFGHMPAYGRLVKLIGDTISETAMLDDLESVAQFTEPIPEMDRRPDEPVLRNWLLGAFTASGLEIELKRRNVKTVVIAGYATQSAVYTAAVQATDLWYSTVIPRDACLTSAQFFWPERDAAELEKQIEFVALDVMAAHISVVTDVTDVIGHLPQ